MCYTKYGCDDTLIESNNNNNNNIIPVQKPQTLRGTLIEYIAKNHSFFQHDIDILPQELKDEIIHEVSKIPGA